MPSRYPRVLSAALLLVLPLVATAQPTVSATVPRVIRLEGRAATPGQQTETLVLAVYDSDSSATPLFEETQEVRVGADGAYAVFLGASRPEGLPATLFSGPGVRWLGVRRAANGEVEQPRVPLASVPYALRAADADTLGGLPPSAFLRTGGTTASGGTGDVASTVTSRATTPLTAGTTGKIGKFVSGVDLGDSVMTENAGRIGLGTATPLDVFHSAFTDASGGLTGYAVQNLSAAANAYSGMLFYDQNGALGQFQGFNNTTHEYRINNIASGGTINFMIGSASRFKVRNDGDIELPGSVRKGGALFLHNRGADNVGLGLNALSSAASPGNVGVGYEAGLSLAGGGGANVAVGYQASRAATAGEQNTGIGVYALRDGQGSFNIGLGAFAGALKASGDFNVYIGEAVANDASNVESGTIRIGDAGFYNRFFVGAVRGVTTGQSNAVAVVIDSNGQLGTVNSSRRYKEDIQDMGDASSGLMQLRPVTYRYTQAYADGSKPIDYGLIAEEVEQVYPDLVAHLKDGEVETVQYHKINAMLLNEVQKQHRQNGEQQAEIEALKARLAALEKLLIEKR